MAGIAMEVPWIWRCIGGMSDERNYKGAERLRVYWLALDFLGATERLLQRLPVKGSLGDQFLRAAESILLNLREGTAHTDQGKKLYHFRLARGSADECIGALHAFGQRYARLNVRSEIRMANMICVMLVALIRAQEQRRDS